MWQFWLPQCRLPYTLDAIMRWNWYLSQPPGLRSRDILAPIWLKSGIGMSAIDSGIKDKMATAHSVTVSPAVVISKKPVFCSVAIPLQKRLTAR